MKEGDRANAEIGKLKSHIAGLEELLKVLEQVSLEQAHSLEFRNIILVTQQEASIDGILIVDENGVVISHNRRFADMWALTPEMILSRNHVEALRPILNKLEKQEFVPARDDCVARQTAVSFDPSGVRCSGRSVNRHPKLTHQIHGTRDSVYDKTVQIPSPQDQGNPRFTPEKSRAPQRRDRGRGYAD